MKTVMLELPAAHLKTLGGAEEIERLLTKIAEARTVRHVPPATVKGRYLETIRKYGPAPVPALKDKMGETFTLATARVYMAEFLDQGIVRRTERGVYEVVK